MVFSPHQVAPLSGSLNGDLLLGLGASPGGGVLVSDLPLPQKPHIQRSSLSVSPADYPEALRRESTPLAVKTEVPLHLVSTTNQHHKQLGVQQQIPTKLALIRGKDKPSKGKASHRTDSTGESYHSCIHTLICCHIHSISHTSDSTGLACVFYQQHKHTHFLMHTLSLSFFLFVFSFSLLSPLSASLTLSLIGYEADSAPEAVLQRRLSSPENPALSQSQPAAPPRPLLQHG